MSSKKHHKKKHAAEEENKSEHVLITPSLTPKSLTASTSIFSDLPINTIFIQKLPIQNKEMLLNKYYKSNPFKNYNPFVTFPNISTEEICSGPTSNAFFDAFFLAFVLHGEIVLSPDDIWIQISSCFAQYVNNYAEKLRDKIVGFQNKKDLIVIYDERDPGMQNMKEKNFRWDVLVNNFSGLIKKNTLNDIGEIIECNYSTTGPVEKIASQISLMNSCEKYFNYRIGVKGCGIRKVHFLGDEQDWISLKEKLFKLRTFNLVEAEEFDNWITKVGKIIDKFIDAYNDFVDLDFWNGIIQEFDGYELKHGSSGGVYYQLSNFVNGWLLDFFLFDNKNEFFVHNLTDKSLTNPEENGFVKKNGKNCSKFKEGTTLDRFPTGFFKAPVLIEYLYGPRCGERIPVNFIAGFSNVVCEDSVYRPQISFAVADRFISEEEKKLKPISLSNK